MSDNIINLQYTTIKDPLPDFIYKGLEEYSKNANGYKPQPKDLVDRLAKNHNVPSEMIFLTAGADEAIQMFIHAYGTNTYAFSPTYVVYSDAKEFGNRFLMAPSLVENEFSISTKSITEATLIFLANPNNPCGLTEKEKVLQLIKNNSHAIVVSDEAYGDFANLSVIEEVKTNKNIAVLKSFSKGFGMAGNRIGYIIANPGVISVVKNKNTWANISYLSVGAAITALDHDKYFNDNNIVVSPGNGNSNIGLDDTFVRISIGTKEQMQIVKELIGEYKK